MKFDLICIVYFGATLNGYELKLNHPTNIKLARIPFSEFVDKRCGLTDCVFIFVLHRRNK
jgi:hypothetical protein